MNALLANARWEARRLLRSQRVFLLLIPPVAGPVGSALALLYFHVSSHPIALMLGLFVLGGLGALVTVDLCALTLGEELAVRAHLALFPLPQHRHEILLGRVAVVLLGSLGAFALGAALTWGTVDLLVPVSAVPGPTLLDPFHLFLGISCLLLFLGGVTLLSSVLVRTASGALVAGVLAGVVVASAGLYLALLHELTLAFPLVLLAVWGVSLAWAVHTYSTLES
ncbi:MAG: hypothetical protein M1144_02170 [Candidatus Thermoplasmatota archaeon]|nr:hypothetical protein [Candidatus Thermoplasmatota archaeon]MCL5984510.1 hypothetical protein [Candidatus Thermoplasmatota archaeon]